MEGNRIACINLQKPTIDFRPIKHLIEVNDEDVPIGKTFCGITVKRNKYYLVYDETCTKKPMCKECIQKQRKDPNPTKSLI